jgi:hypothetical protein
LLLSQLVCHSGKGNCPVKHKRKNVLKQQTLPLMGATRPASGHFSAAPSCVGNYGKGSQVEV